MIHPTIPARFQISAYMPVRPRTGVTQIVCIDPIKMKDLTDDGEKTKFLKAAVVAAGATLGDPLVFVDIAYLNAAGGVPN